MAIVGQKGGLFSALKQWVKDGRPVRWFLFQLPMPFFDGKLLFNSQIWGTCAGMILLSDHAIKQASGGQTLMGGLDVHVCRNYFGSQVQQNRYPSKRHLPNWCNTRLSV